MRRRIDARVMLKQEETRIVVQGRKIHQPQNLAWQLFPKG